MSHDTLHMLANGLGLAAVFTIVCYHVVAVNARYIQSHHK